MLVAVTGADGFVGRHVCRALRARGCEVRPAVRDEACAERARDLIREALPPVVVGEIGPSTDWSAALAGAEAVIHLAARVHVMDEKAVDPLEAFREVNVRGTRRLAAAAAASGVRRLVFVSSIKVNGESTTGRGPFSERDAPDPRDAYGLSKWEAEQALAEVGASTGLETVTVRPPLVHGPGVGGNLLRLLRLVSRSVPLPFAGVRNRRTLIAADNLADLLALCAVHPAAVGRTFTAGDGEDLSTADLIRALAAGLGRPALLVPAPHGLLRTLASPLGRSAALDRLTGSLQVDSTTVCEVLGWTPPVTTAEGLARMGRWYRDTGGRPQAG